MPDTIDSGSLTSVPEPLPKVPSAESFAFPEFYVKYRGIFNFQELYKYIMGWLAYRKFVVFETTHKFKPPELELDIEGKRRTTSYLRHNVIIHIHMFFAERIPAIKDGKPIEMVRARIKIDLKGEVETGYPDYFGKSLFDETMAGKRIKKWINRIFNKDIEFKHQDNLYYEVYELQAGIKEQLNKTAKGSAY
jgi:hypothetical protein